LRKITLLSVIVVAGLSSIAMIPSASARSGVAAVSRSSVSACPPGGASPNYCEPHCVVPRLDGDGLLGAIVKIKIANCRLGALFFYYPPTASTPKLIPANYHLFTVVAQHPRPGEIRPFDAKVTLWVVVKT